MNSVTDILRQFPAIWATIGLLAGGGVMFIVAQKFGPMKNEALQEVVGAYKEQIVANRGLLEMQKSHYEIELSDLKVERDNYRTALHGEKEAHQATLLTVADLQSRPNLDKVYEGQQAFFEKNTDCMQAILEALQEHDSGIEDRTKQIIEPVVKVCEQIVAALNGHKLKKA